MPKIEDFEHSLRIDENSIDAALQEQPQNFYFVAKELTLLISRRDEAKKNLAEVEAEVDTEIRDDATNEERKITEKEVASLKALDKRVIRSNKEYSLLASEVGKWAALKEAYGHRLEALKSMVRLHLSNYYSTDITIRDRETTDARARHAERAKEETKKERNRRRE